MSDLWLRTTTRLRAIERGHVLAFDIGNSRAKWAMHDGLGWSISGSISTIELETTDLVLPPLPADTRAVVSNVASARALARLQQVLHEAGVPLTTITAKAQQCGVKNTYEVPHQLGADRWAALIGAYANAHVDQLVVLCGTALTVDALTADGTFLGGTISPGLQLMRESLAVGTANLPMADSEVAQFPRNTQQAIASGTMNAALGAVERMHRHLARMGLPPRRVVLSGGWVKALAAELPFEAKINEHLVLDGLLIALAEELSHP